MPLGAQVKDENPSAGRGASGRGIFLGLFMYVQDHWERASIQAMPATEG